ncbi:MAG: carboxypeptidase regulatory-like domain-containing protein [Rhodobacteraceae bacterium]|nr:carboxypeptidase regulatory-like domain-containing protein [Paracoccaceae bacterium]
MYGKKLCLWLCGLAYLALSAPDMGARADGDAFFEPQEIPGNPIYVMFGSVKDERGNYLSSAKVTVNVAEPVLIYDTTTNILGRFRTVDVGRAIIELGYDLDPAQIDVSVSAAGYVLERRFKRNSLRQTQGIIEIDFVMAREK